MSFVFTDLSGSGWVYTVSHPTEATNPPGPNFTDGGGRLERGGADGPGRAPGGDAARGGAPPPGVD